MSYYSDFTNGVHAASKNDIMGHVDIWTRGYEDRSYVDTWIHGYKDTWTRGYRDTNHHCFLQKPSETIASLVISQVIILGFGIIPWIRGYDIR